MNNTLGLYLHIPFCKQKCAYCDFYSLAGSETHMDAYCAGTGCAWEQCSVAASLLNYYDRKEDTDHEQCER